MTHQAWINDLPENTQLEIVKHHTTAFRQLENPSKRIIRYVINHHPEIITKNNNMEIEEQLLLVSNHPELFCRIADPYDEVINLAVESRPENILDVETPSREVQWIAFMKKPELIVMYHDLTNSVIDDDIRTYANMVK